MIYTNCNTVHVHQVSLSIQDTDFLEALFSLVSGRQLTSACQLACKHRDFKSAALLSQATCGDVNFKQMAYEQLDMWRRMGVSIMITDLVTCRSHTVAELYCTLYIYCVILNYV